MKITIPTCLENLKVCLLSDKDRVDDEIYTYNSEEVSDHLGKGQNIGVITGEQNNNLFVIDAEHESLSERIYSRYPNTFVIQTPKGKKHYYFYGDGFCPTTKLQLSSNGLRIGSVIGQGKKIDNYVVSYGSRFWHVDKYKMYRPISEFNAEIQTITKEEFDALLPEYYEENKLKIKIKKMINQTNINEFLIEGRFNPIQLCEWIENNFIVLVNNETGKADDCKVYIYDEERGVYVPDAAEYIIKCAIEKVCNLLNVKVKNTLKTETLIHLRDRNLPIMEPNYFAEPRYVAYKEYVYDCEKNELLRHQPHYLTTLYIPHKAPSFHYLISEEGDDKKPKKFLKFLSEIIDEKYHATIQEMYGYCLYPSYRFGKAFMLLGEGANGKSVLLGVLRAMLGYHNVSSCSLQDFANNRFAVSQLKGKFANIYADLPSTFVKNSAQFKMLTGGDYIFSEEKYEKGTQFKNFAKLIFSANQTPPFSDSTYAFFRRWIILKFERVFEEAEQDPFLLEKLTSEDEIEKILQWSFEGLQRLLKNGKFSYHLSVDDVRDEYLSGSNSIYAFAISCLVDSPGNIISKNELYNAYVQFCKVQGREIETKNKLTRFLPNIVSFSIIDKGLTRIGNKKPELAWQNVDITDEWKEKLKGGVGTNDDRQGYL